MEQPENNEKPMDQKSKVKFKIMSLKVKEGTDYVPEMVSFVFPTLFLEHDNLHYCHKSIFVLLLHFLFPSIILAVQLCSSVLKYG